MRFYIFQYLIISHTPQTSCAPRIKLWSNKRNETKILKHSGDWLMVLWTLVCLSVGYEWIQTERQMWKLCHVLKQIVYTIIINIFCFPVGLLFPHLHAYNILNNSLKISPPPSPKEEEEKTLWWWWWVYAKYVSINGSPKRKHFME